MKDFNFRLTSFEIDDYFKLYRSTDNELKDMDYNEFANYISGYFKQMHDIAFKRIVPASKCLKKITFNTVKEEYLKFEKQYARNFPENDFLGLESENRVNKTIRYILSYLENEIGLKIEEDEPEEEIVKIEEKPVIATREIKKTDDSEVFKVMKSFYKWLGDYIETRNNATA